MDMPTHVPRIFALPPNIIAKYLRQLGRDELMALALTSKEGLSIVRVWSFCFAQKLWQMETVVTSKDTVAAIQANTRNGFASLSTEVLSIILLNLQPYNSLLFSYTNRMHRELVMEDFRSRVSIILTQFRLSPPHFFRIMHLTRSIIGGSVPLYVLTNHSFPLNNVDVYVPASQEDTFLALLTRHTPFKSPDGPRHQEIDRTIKYMYEVQADSRIMHIWICIGENASLSVFASPSSCLMNFISVWGIYCAHPRLTLDLRGVAIHHRFIGPANAHVFLSKYMQRAITHQQQTTAWPEYQGHQCRTSNVCPQTVRDMYDAKGLFINFPARSKPNNTSVNVRYDGKHTVIWGLGPCGSRKMHAKSFSVSHLLDTTTFQ
ncbi:hypothetical protein B0H11DRAFT_1919806 [Mycena galericulata]|nr:hypothetical protein B0H11DRAFT_1919806 [Mycena galericulata]